MTVARSATHLERVLSVGVLAIFSWGALSLILQSGVLPHWDYWVSVPLDLSQGRLQAEMARWFVPFNEHYVIIPHLFYTANRFLFGGNNIVLGLVAFGFAWLQAICLCLMARRSVTHQLGKWVLIVMVAIASFTPMASHNWISGMSGVAWVSANAFAVLAVTLLYFGVQRSSWWCLAAILCGVLASLCYTTGLAVWPALLLGALFLRASTFKLLLLFGASAAAVGTYFSAYEVPGHNPDIEFSVSALSQYIGAYMGAAWTLSKPQVIWVGMATIAVIVGLSFRSFDDADLKRRAPWVMLAVFVGGTAMMAAMSRAGFGVYQGIGSRYATLHALGAVSLLGLLVTWVRSQGDVGWRRVPVATVLIPVVLVSLFAWAAYVKSAGQTAHNLSKVPRKEVAGIALILGLEQHDVLSAYLSPRFSLPEWREAAIPILETIDHLPFHESFLDCPAMGEQIDIANAQIVRGFVDKSQTVPGGRRLEGWAYAENDQILCLVLTDAEQAVVGYGGIGFDRPDVRASVGEQAEAAGWIGYTRGAAHPIYAYVLLASDRRWARFPQ